MSTFHSLEEAKAFFVNDRFATENYMALEALTEDSAVCTMDINGRHMNAEGHLMGGAILALADFTFAAASNKAHRPSVAQQVSLNFLNASKGKKLVSTAVCVKSGRTSCVYVIHIKDDLGKDVAQAMFTGFKL